MSKITPHLWFDKEAIEASELYRSTFPDSRVIYVNTLYDTPSGDTDVVSFELFDQRFMAISAGPLFKFTPAVSFLVSCKEKEQVDKFWAKLSEGGQILMPLGSYPFSEHYGWTEDKFGLSWQIMYAGGRDVERPIIPTLLFVGDVCGKAEEAINFYTSVFPNSRVGDIVRYGSDEKPESEGTVKHSTFWIDDDQFAAMDSALEHNFAFNESISFMVSCQTQEEIDDYWHKLSAVPEAEQCGWLKDKFGVSWQIVPVVLDEMMGSGTKEQIAEVTSAFLQMKKFDIAELQGAFEKAAVS